jgi:hypothetical protein
MSMMPTMDVSNATDNKTINTHASTSLEINIQIENKF